MIRVLILDDEYGIRKTLKMMLSSDTYDVRLAENIAEASGYIAQWDPEILLCDLNLPDGSGLDFLKDLRRNGIAPKTIMLTAYGSSELAVEAMKIGAIDFLSKPFEPSLLLDKINLLAQSIQTGKHSKYIKENKGLARLIGNSAALHRIKKLIKQVIDINTTVLLEGDSGTGKEVVAKALFEESNRSDQPFISINCGALPEQLLESELFGYEKGSFTGADKQKIGLIEASNNGILFLDEIGEMPLGLQVKLLRFLQEGCIRRIGGLEEFKVNVRIFCATNKNLAKSIKDGNFREDLYYRINVFPIKTSPLVDRKEDIIPLAMYFLHMGSVAMDKKMVSISSEAKNILLEYNWPGNVRELKNVIQRGIILAQTNVLETEDFQEIIPQHLKKANLDTTKFDTVIMPEGFDLEDYMDKIRWKYMSRAMEESGGNQTVAAQMLGMSFRSFRYYYPKLMAKYLKD